MRRLRTIIVSSVLLIAGVAVALVLLVWIGGRLLLPQPEDLYPRAPKMPPRVPQTVEDLLGRFEGILRDRAPDVLASMQPGLTDAEIDALQSKGRFVLPDDLRALYRWRNGSPRDRRIDVFAGHHFVALDEALKSRDLQRQQVKSATLAQKWAYEALAKHREGWLGLMVDGAGDGYFLDPGRSEAEGSFFFCFAEDGSYVFFPGFRNFLAATIEGHESDVLTFGDHGAETVDYEMAQKLWGRYGAEAPLNAGDGP